MLKKVMLFIVLFIFITNFLNIHTLFADRIGDIRDKIEEEKEKEEEKPKPKPDDDDDDDDDSGGGCLGFGLFGSGDDDDDDDYYDSDDDDDYDDYYDSDGDSGCTPVSGEPSGCKGRCVMAEVYSAGCKGLVRR